MTATDSTPEPRTVLRNLIAEKIHEAECGCGSSSEPARHMADAVMEVFAGPVEQRLVYAYNRPIASYFSAETLPAPLPASPQPVEETPA